MIDCLPGNNGDFGQDYDGDYDEMKRVKMLTKRLLKVTVVAVMNNNENDGDEADESDNGSDNE